MKYEVLIVRKMFLNEPETARRKKSFIYFIPGHGRAGNKRRVESDWLSLRSWRDLCESASAVLFLRRSNPCASRQLRSYDKLPDDQTQPTLEMTPGFKPFTARQINHFCILGFLIKRQKSDKHCKLITDVICALCFSAGGACVKVYKEG